MRYPRRNGLNAVSKEKESDRLTAMRRSILFPGLLHELGLSAFKEERFMMKIAAQDQGRGYKRDSADIRRCGFFFSVTVPNEATLCAMKLSALLTRGKGRWNPMVARRQHHVVQSRVREGRGRVHARPQA